MGRKAMDLTPPDACDKNIPGFTGFLQPYPCYLVRLGNSVDWRGGVRVFFSAGLPGARGAQAGIEGLVVSFPPGVSLSRFGAIASRQFQRSFSLSKRSWVGLWAF